MSEDNWPKQDDPDVKEINIGILRQVMGLLYETHITTPTTANLRGQAIQAVNGMLADLGYNDAYLEQQAIPWSQRRRYSEIWVTKEDDEK